MRQIFCWLNHCESSVRLHRTGSTTAIIVAGAMLTSCGDSPNSPEPAKPDPAVATAMTASTATHISGVVGDSVAIAVLVSDQNGKAMPGVSVHFTVTDGAGTLKAAHVPTDAHGISSNVLRLPLASGSARVVATHLQLSPVEFTADAIAGAAAQLVIQSQPSSIRIDQGFTTAPAIAFVDRFGNVAAGVPVTASIGTGGGSLDGAVTISAADGVARFNDLQLRGPIGSRTLRFAAPGLQPVETSAFMLLPAPRSDTDRADDIGGSQIHIVYAVPSDGTDRSYDTAVDLAYSSVSFQTWLAQKTGYRLRLDTYHGAADVTFVRLNKTDAEMSALGAFVRDEIERQMRSSGSLVSGKIYAVYYDGISNYACGGASWPPLLQGQLAAMYLKGLPSGVVPCGNNPFVPAPTEFPRYWEFAMLHDLLHTLGIVSSQAPHHVADRPGHVPEQNDLMYAGAGPWLYGQSMVVDVGGDDYFGPAVATTLPNIAGNPFTERVTSAFLLLSPLAEPSEQNVRAVREAISAAPFHPPFEMLLSQRGRN